MDNKNIVKEQTVSEWAKKSQLELIKLGITDGTRPQDLVTREEAWTMIHRAFQIKETKPTIVLDPGHGGKDRANKGHFGYIEADGNLKFCLYLKSFLDNCFNVILTRNKDLTLSLTERANMAINNNAAIFISVHSDAHSNSIAKGVTVFDSVDLNNELIGEEIGKAIATANNTTFRGSKERESTKHKGEDYYTVIDVAQDGKVPIVLLIERGFHTNAEDCKALIDDKKIKQSAKATADILIERLT